ncbi:hypothetical protein N7488_007767 [Penicillium malachiteum]|nr:hypothetical protein N7488_007767 [Penicillium malachiteum]
MPSFNFEHFERFEAKELRKSEQGMRKTVQLEETWIHRLKALQKSATVEDDSTSDTKLQVDEINKQFLKIQVQYTEQEFKLYHEVSILPSKWKEAYLDLRLNEKWFMRPEMVIDCSDQGGCCSRDCGC